MNDIDQTMIDEVIDQFRLRLNRRIQEKGPAPFCSEHEALGVIMEEVQEFANALHDREPNFTKSEELYDIMITSFWGVLSYKQGMREKRKKDQLQGEYIKG